MKPERWFWLLSAAALGLGWMARPLLPPDELRYLAVAWEMQDSGSLLVPVLNGAPYSHKPPLLFWLYQGGWSLFGVSAWWPRLVQAAGALLVLLLLERVARRLAPPTSPAPRCALLLYGGGLLFQVYAGGIFFDIWLTSFVFLAWLGLLRACPAQNGQQPAPASGWLIFSLATAAAILTKGPAALISILPPALLLPLWAAPRPHPWRSGIGLGLALLGASGLALAWAVPAAHAGGAEYGAEILYGQSAGRLRDSFAHARPFWWYLALLPILTLPYVAWPALWRRAALSASAPPPRALVRFGLCAFLPALLLFSLVSGKQPHYLLPALGGLALLAAARIRGAPAPAPARWPASAAVLPRLALLAPALLCIVYVSGASTLQSRYDLRQPARAVAEAQAAGRPTAFFGAKYHGQFHFLGRLRAPVDNPESPKTQRRWLAANPEGLVAFVRSGPPDARLSGQPISSQPYGSRRLELWRARDLAPLLQ